jgi:hypothetical protein
VEWLRGIEEKRSSEERGELRELRRIYIAEEGERGELKVERLADLY